MFRSILPGDPVHEPAAIYPPHLHSAASTRSEFRSCSDELLPTGEVMSSLRLALDELVADAPLLALSANEVLFEEGEHKSGFYRVEAGVIRVVVNHSGQPPECIAMAEAGDLLGLGFLERHASTAHALVASTVSCLSTSMISALAGKYSEFKRQEAVATEQEFATLRGRSVRSVPRKPVQQLAGFLAIVSRLNENEGRDPGIVTDTMDGRLVADLLGLDIDALIQAFAELEKRALIERCQPEGIRLRDRGELERISNDG